MERSGQVCFSLPIYKITCSAVCCVHYMYIGLIPQDGLPVPVIATVSTPVTVMFTLLNVFGIAFALTCLAFNIVFREKKYVVADSMHAVLYTLLMPHTSIVCCPFRLIRLSSPNLNYLMITGTILMYSSGTVFLLPTRSPSTTLAFCFVSIEVLWTSWVFIVGLFIEQTSFNDRNRCCCHNSGSNVAAYLWLFLCLWDYRS